MRGKKPLAIDVFCGAGGMSLGFEQAGFDVVAAFDIEERHVETHRLNFPKTRAVQLDLSKAPGATVRAEAGIGRRAIDVLFGGPPCQGFSVGGLRCETDPRNFLILHFARLVRELHPRYFVVENVEGLLYPHAEEILKSFIRRIRRAKYDVCEPISVLDAADFGVPQHRRRTFILGCRRDLPLPQYPSPRGLVGLDGTAYAPVVSDALAGLGIARGPNHRRHCKLCSMADSSGSHYAQLMSGQVRDPADHSYQRKWPAVISGCETTLHSADVKVRFSRTKPGKQELISRYYKLCVQGRARTIRAGTGDDHGSHTAPRPIHPCEPRCVTVREAARLHSYPDWFQFHSTIWHSFRQIGNSVPPLLARAVAMQLRDALSSSARRSG